ncbi:MAG: hypothetical protein KKB50_06120 [Planctomycetes bacterium]|nr:hypothetical protein [Planctomycetota bacterium]
MRERFVVAILAIVAFCAAPALAQCQKTCQKTCEKAATCDKANPCQVQGKACCVSKDQDKACCKSQGQTTALVSDEKGSKAMCDSAVTCDGDRVRYEEIKLPRIGFMVGDKVTCCMKSATEMAGGDATKIHYVVAGENHKDLNEAKAARVKLLEQYYEDMFKVQYAVGEKCVACPVTAKELAKSSYKPMRYRLVAFDFANEAEAAKAAEAARAAAKKVNLSWAVGDKNYGCPTEAGKAAKACGQKVEYCVGDQKTECETTAQTRLIEARIMAALQEIAKAAHS